MARTFGEILQKLRKSKGLTQKEVAAGLGLSTQYYCQQEQGKRVCSQECIKRIEKYFGVKGLQKKSPMVVAEAVKKCSGTRLRAVIRVLKMPVDDLRSFLKGGQ